MRPYGKESMNRNIKLLAIAGLTVLVAFAANLCFGVSGLSPEELLRALMERDAQSKAWRILRYARLPRALAAFMAGSALATAGLLLQSVLRNPLASPGVIGVNAGAGLCALAVMAFFPAAAGLVPAAAFAGACVAAFAVYLLARLAGSARSTLVLAGVAINSLLGAAMDAIVTLVPDAAVSRSAFSIGGFANVTMDRLAFALPFWAVGLLAALLLRRELSIMRLGDDVARSLGLPVERYRAVFLIAAAMLAGAAVSFAGLVGFVGLITPHIAALLCRRDERLHTPVAMLLGAALCLLCDLAARLLFAPGELPVGVVLSFIGAPFFLWLLIRKKRRDGCDTD